MLNLPTQLPPQHLMIAFSNNLLAELLAKALESKIPYNILCIKEQEGELFNILDTHKPAYLLIESNYKNNEGFGFLKKLSRIKPNVKVIIYANTLNYDYLKVFLSSPAIGLIHNGCSLDKFVYFLNEIIRGKRVIYSNIESPAIESPSSFMIDDENKIDLSLLTEREMDVWELLEDAKKEKQIAEILHISANTVKTHKSNISKKLGIKREKRLSTIVYKRRRIY